MIRLLILLFLAFPIVSVDHHPTGACKIFLPGGVVYCYIGTEEQCAATPGGEWRGPDSLCILPE